MQSGQVRQRGPGREVEVVVISPRTVRSWLAVATLAAISGCGLVAPPESHPHTSTSTPPSARETPTVAMPATADVQVRGFSDAEQASLRVRNLGCGGVSTGSGFAISTHVFITNRHVVGGASLLQVSGYDGRDIVVTTSGAATIADLALVRTVQSLPATVRLAAGNPSEGTPVAAIGFPLGGPLTTTHGRVLGYSRDPVGWSTLPMLVNDAPIEHGSSGSALLNNEGELVGVVYATAGSSKQYAVPIEVLRSVLDDTSQFENGSNCDGVPDTPAPGASNVRCSQSVSAGANTSCPFALNVAAAWTAAGGGAATIQAHSPVTGESYEMDCVDGSPVICSGGNNAVVYIEP